MTETLEKRNVQRQGSFNTSLDSEFDNIWFELNRLEQINDNKEQFRKYNETLKRIVDDLDKIKDENSQLSFQISQMKTLNEKLIDMIVNIQEKTKEYEDKLNNSNKQFLSTSNLKSGPVIIDFGKTKEGLNLFKKQFKTTPVVISVGNDKIHFITCSGFVSTDKNFDWVAIGN